MRHLLRILFGCAHRRRTFPQTIKGRCWVTCLACGKSFDYDWDNMTVLKGRK